MRLPNPKLAAFLVVGAYAVGLAVTTAIAVPTAPSHAFTLCETGLPAPVFAEFDVPDGESIFHHFPSLGITPEISEPEGPLHDGPLHVVALVGRICDIPAYYALYPDAPEPEANNVLLVTRADGDTWTFSDVDFTTFVP